MATRIKGRSSGHQTPKFGWVENESKGKQLRFSAATLKKKKALVRMSYKVNTGLEQNDYVKVKSNANLI